jgi:hypothetical protein
LGNQIYFLQHFKSHLYPGRHTHFLKKRSHAFKKEADKLETYFSKGKKPFENEPGFILLTLLSKMQNTLGPQQPTPQNVSAASRGSFGDGAWFLDLEVYEYTILP